MKSRRILVFATLLATACTQPHAVTDVSASVVDYEHWRAPRLSMDVAACAVTRRGRYCWGELYDGQVTRVGETLPLWVDAERECMHATGARCEQVGAVVFPDPMTATRDPEGARWMTVIHVCGIRDVGGFWCEDLRTERSPVVMGEGEMWSHVDATLRTRVLALSTTGSLYWYFYGNTRRRLRGATGRVTAAGLYDLGACAVLADDPVVYCVTTPNWDDLVPTARSPGGWVFISSRCGIDAEGRVACWQSPSEPDDVLPLAHEVPLPRRALEVRETLGTGCALLDDHEVWCWGTNVRGMMGPQATLGSEAPVRVLPAPP